MNVWADLHSRARNNQKKLQGTWWTQDGWLQLIYVQINELYRDFLIFASLLQAANCLYAHTSFISVCIVRVASQFGIWIR